MEIVDFGRDLRHLLAAFRARFPRPFRLEANHQIQVLSSPFFRNQTAYIAGRVVNGIQTLPFVVAVKHTADGRLYVDALVTGEPSEPVMGEAREYGVHFLAGGHYATETFGIRRLGELVAERFGIEHEFVDVPNPV